MIDCDRARRLLSAHALGEMEEQDRAPLAGHLSACEACRREEARLARTLSALRAMPELPPSALRKERALAAAKGIDDGAGGRPAGRRFRLAWVAALAGALLVALLAHHATRPRPEAFTLSVVGVEGVVERLEGERWVRVTIGGAVASGASLRTQAGRATLASSRGDRVDLDTGSQLDVEAGSDAEDCLLLGGGRLYCEAAKRVGRRLVIRTPAGRVEVVGTKFEVSYR